MPLEVILIIAKDPTLGRERLTRPVVKAYSHNTSGQITCRPGGINNFYWRNRALPSLNVSNIQQPDLVPSEPDKAPHPMMAPEQIWR